MPQVAINWLLRRPGRSPTEEQVARLDAASARTAPYRYFPYERQEGFARLDPHPLRKAGAQRY